MPLLRIYIIDSKELKENRKVVLLTPPRTRQNQVGNKAFPYKEKATILFPRAIPIVDRANDKGSQIAVKDTNSITFICRLRNQSQSIIPFIEH